MQVKHPQAQFRACLENSSCLGHKSRNAEATRTPLALKLKGTCTVAKQAKCRPATKYRPLLCLIFAAPMSFLPVGRRSVNDRGSRRRGSYFFPAPAEFQFLPGIWPGIFD